MPAAPPSIKRNVGLVAGIALPLFVALALSLLGCGGADDDAVDAQAESIAASSYCETIAPFFCEFYLRCGRMDVESEEACLPAFLESCNAKYEGAYVELEAKGFLNLNPQGVAACREHLSKVACEQQIFELAGPCAGIWDGHQGPGQACGLDVEFFVCAAGTECVLGLDFCGTCRPLAAVGASCTPGEDTCGTEASCIDGACVARKKNGEGCGAQDRCYAGSGCIEGLCTGPSFVALNDACDRDHRCPYLTECIAGSCQRAVLLGEDCDATTPCATGYCDGLCKAPQANGASCAGSAQCRSGLCDRSVCTARPSACLQ